ncbi:MAG: Solute:Sodium Symporter [Deltaproteobacteria bacterium]|nr:Solute:Sodium Symporter [Deltaproteobacteria bacterium]
MKDVKKRKGHFGNSSSEHASSIIVSKKTKSYNNKEASTEGLSQIHLVTDSLPVLIAYIDKDLQYRYVNKTFEDWFGITKEKIYGKHIKDVVGDDTYNVLQKYIEKTLTGKRVLFEEKLVYKTGSKRFVSGILVPEPGVNSGVKGFYALVSDISERKAMEEVILISEERYRALFQNIPVGVGISTINGRILAYNEMMQKITGYSKSALEKLNTKDLYNNKEDREKLVEIFKKEGAVHNFKTLLRQKNGSLLHVSLNIVSYSIGN